MSVVIVIVMAILVIGIFVVADTNDSKVCNYEAELKKQDKIVSNKSDTDKIYELTHELVICRCEKVDLMLKVNQLENQLEKFNNKIEKINNTENN